MASDNLNQVGKYIKRVRDDTDFALKKYYRNIRVEKTRDVFDSQNPFVMEFKTGKHDTATLDLTFSKPPPREGCSSGCVSTSCESFTFTDGADHLIQLSHTPLIANSVKVFRNNALLPFYNFEETDLENGLVYVQGSGGNDTFVLCYIYGDCVLPPFDAQHLHAYYGTFTFSADQGTGATAMANYQATVHTTVVFADTNLPEGYHFNAFSEYRTAWGLIVLQPNSYSTGFAYTDNLTYPINSLIYVRYNDPFNILGRYETFTTNVYEPQPTAFATAGINYNVAGTTNVMWWVDPIDWVYPTTPKPNQQVINDLCAVGTGVDTVFNTSFPYLPGTLYVEVYGQPTSIIETNPATGEFAFLVPPAIGYMILAQYYAA